MKNIGSLFYKPPKTDGEKPKRWNIFAIIWKALKRFCMALGVMVLISLTISIFTISNLASRGAPPLPHDMVLVYEIDGGVTEVHSKPTILEPFPYDQPTIRKIINAIEKATDDARVRGLVVNLESGGMNVAHIQELRAAIEAFKASGKFTKIYSTSYDDAMGGLSQYYLASVFDEIWMQPVGMLSMSGANLEMPFAKDALGKLGVQTQFLKREKYKSAMENFSATEMSAPNREMWSAIINDQSMQMMQTITQERGMDMATLKQQIDKGLLTGSEALEVTLIDHLDYGDVMVSTMRETMSGNADDESVKLVSIGQYAQEKVKPTKQAQDKKSIALVYAVGAIMDVAGAQGGAGADEIAGAINAATKDETIEAIVLRVDSPGGSPSASESIRRALVRAKEKGKKVVVSMGPVAASGGYWVATDADMIVALPGTITGSIGVIMGKFEASELWKKLGVNWQGPQVGANADMFSINQPFDDVAQSRMTVLIDDVYDAFLTRVAKGRNMTKEQARQVAQGRAWSGEQAKDIGLVDTLGGLNVALDEAAKMIGMTNRNDLTVIRLPRELNPIEQFVQMFVPKVSLGYFFDPNSQLIKQFSAYKTQAELSQHNAGAIVYNAELEMLR